MAKLKDILSIFSVQLLSKITYIHFSEFQILFFGYLSHHSSFADDLPNHIISGRVLIKPNIGEFTETLAIFEDGTEEDLDVVIFATGYTFYFPFLGNDSTVLDSQCSMFKFVFPPQQEKPTLAFIGILQPVGPPFPHQNSRANGLFVYSRVCADLKHIYKRWPSR